MAYIRGHFYIYDGGGYTYFGHGHSSAPDGPEGKVEDNTLCVYTGDQPNPGESIYLPDYIVEEFVVMKYARMTPEEIEAAEQRVIDKYGGGNFGADGVMEKHGQETVMQQVMKVVPKGGDA